MHELEKIISDIGRIRSKFNEEKAEIKKNASLSESGRSEQIREAFKRRRDEYEKLRKEFETQREKTAKHLQERAFGIGNNSGTSDALAFDDMVYRMRKAGPLERRERLQNASLKTAVAVGKAAYLAGDNQTVDAYANQFNLVEYVQPLVDFDSKFNPDKMPAAQKLSLNFALSFPTNPE